MEALTDAVCLGDLALVRLCRCFPDPDRAHIRDARGCRKIHCRDRQNPQKIDPLFFEPGKHSVVEHVAVIACLRS